MQPVVPTKETPSHACAEKPGRGRATVAKYGREHMRELGRRGNAAKRERRARIKLALEDTGDVWADISSKRVLWEKCVDMAYRDKDARSLLAILQYCTDRTHGKAAQTHLVAVQHNMKLSEDDLRKVRELTDIIQRAQHKSLPDVIDVVPPSWGPAPGAPSAPASAESPRDLPDDVLQNHLLRENGIALPGHPETLPPAPGPRRNGRFR